MCVPLGVSNERAAGLVQAERWLRAQIGRPWNTVRSELVQRFDRRTTAGRHLLCDHLLHEIERGFGLLWPHDVTVDRRGILRCKPRPPRRAVSARR